MITMGEAQEELPPGWYHRLQPAADAHMHAPYAHAHHLFFIPHSHPKSVLSCKCLCACVSIQVLQRGNSSEMVEK